MDYIKKAIGLSTPQAPKLRSRDLPTLGEGEVPPLVPGWSSSSDGGSSGSSVASSLPSTPSASPVSWRRTQTPFRPPSASVRSPTPQYDVSSPAWHVTTMSRQTFTPSPEIMKPRPRRAESTHHPSPVQVMQGLVSPQPVPAKPIKSILKHSAQLPRSAASTPAPRMPRKDEIRLHWQLCPYDTYKAGRPIRLEFDISKPVDLIVVRDYSRAGQKLARGEMKRYLDRRVCEDVELREMTIQYEKLPQWKVVITRSDGDVLRVRDVFEALYENLRTTVNRQDRSLYMPRDKVLFKACTDAFIKRCHDSTTSVSESERHAGIRRVDFLMGENAFLGLTRPQKDDQDCWIAHFGPLPPASP